MIILAAAIILSLSNSGIISKANKAKTDSDTANLKEYVNTLRAEWELMTEAERTKSGAATFEDYANEKLEEGGYKQRLSEDGILMNETSTAAVKAGIKIGDVVNYSTLLTEKSYTTDGSERSLTGVADETKKQTVKTNTSYTWKYIGISENGNLLIAPDLPEGTINSEYKIGFEGEGVAYSKGPEILNTICDALYTVEGKGTARSMNVNDVLTLLEYNGPRGSYRYGNEVVDTTEPIALKELEAKFNINLEEIHEEEGRYTPEGKKLGEYKCDVYNIDMTKNSDRITGEVVKQKLIYQPNDYMLASRCFGVDFDMYYLLFMIFEVTPNCVTASDSFTSCLFRPVVELSSNVKLTPNADKIEWTIK